MIDTMGPLAREHGVDIAFSAPEGRLMVVGDRDELLRVVENLIENAVKYGGTGKRIEVAADLRGHFVVHPTLDGRRVRMLVDIGASLIALSH